MIKPTFIGSLVSELLDRGLTRDEIANRIGVPPASVSHLKAGRGSLGDSKISALADLHGGFTADEIKAAKYLEWLEREKGLTIQDLQNAQTLCCKKSIEQK